MTTIRLDLSGMPPVIAESARCVLTAHGLHVCMPNGRRLTDDERDALFSEVGRNASQALISIDLEAETAGVELTAELVEDLERVAKLRGTTAAELLDQLLNSALDSEGAK